MNRAAALVAVAAAAVSRSALAILVVFILAAPGCKKESNESEAALAKMSEFKDKMCACHDKACADMVQNELNSWAADNAMHGHRMTEGVSEATMKRMQDVGTLYGECLAKAMSAPPAIAVTKVETPAPAPEPPITTAEEFIARTFAAPRDLAVSRLSLSYIRADGTFDPTYGDAEAQLGLAPAPKAADDPDRPIGAPIKEPPPAPASNRSTCPIYGWKAKALVQSTTGCDSVEEPLARPRCRITDIWKHAIAAGAPDKALAVLELVRGRPQTWTVTIEDAPRGIHFRKGFEDTCEPTLEKPAP